MAKTVIDPRSPSSSVEVLVGLCCTQCSSSHTDKKRTVRKKERLFVNITIRASLNLFGSGLQMETWQYQEFPGLGYRWICCRCIILLSVIMPVLPLPFLSSWSAFCPSQAISYSGLIVKQTTWGTPAALDYGFNLQMMMSPLPCDRAQFHCRINYSQRLIGSAESRSPRGSISSNGSCKYTLSQHTRHKALDQYPGVHITDLTKTSQITHAVASMGGNNASVEICISFFRLILVTVLYNRRPVVEVKISEH